MKALFALTLLYPLLTGCAPSQDWNGDLGWNNTGNDTSQAAAPMSQDQLNRLWQLEMMAGYIQETSPPVFSNPVVNTSCNSYGQMTNCTSY